MVSVSGNKHKQWKDIDRQQLRNKTLLSLLSSGLVWLMMWAGESGSQYFIPSFNPTLNTLRLPILTVDTRRYSLFNIPVTWTQLSTPQPKIQLPRHYFYLQSTGIPFDRLISETLGRPFLWAKNIKAYRFSLTVEWNELRLLVQAKDLRGESKSQMILLLWAFCIHILSLDEKEILHTFYLTFV